MDHQLKLNIYKGMIQYILDSTHYTLKNIADLSGSSLDIIRAIYCHNAIPHSFKSEMQILKLYQIVLEINSHPKNQTFAG
ncbi:hypothetical protein A6J40_12910 [Legionella longbeachae]|uniref:hypothetical protein n=1 Tax=Legionella longbeachae TaxID=450 RepID=UPI0009B7E111|nr:hypothetical protein [Legionella longbeachae]ARB93022.1 hypothetical protein A6J40_12910 [Legionella longbeachae]RZV23864.1 hypothetical protein EKG34_11805 [Legionella longbeachae]UAK47088.1 hypothetical protein K8O86_02520 [Legionella longbeachae]VEE04143.1 Uncharacterised protein [Legionella oakridgensis]